MNFSVEQFREIARLHLDSGILSLSLYEQWVSYYKINRKHVPGLESKHFESIYEKQIYLIVSVQHRFVRGEYHCDTLYYKALRLLNLKEIQDDRL